jgi:hypothetical protein
LSWSDFEAKASSEKQYADFSVDPNLKAALKSRLNVQADVVAFESLLDKNPVQFFVSGIRGQSNTTPRALSAILTATAQPALLPPVDEALRAEGIELPDGMVALLNTKTRIGLGAAGGVRLAWGVDANETPAQENPDLGGVPLAICYEPATSREPRSDWNGLLHILNRLQHLPGLHVVMPGLEDVPVPGASPTGGPIPASGWSEINDYVSDEVLPVVQALAGSGLPPPDVVGADLMTGDVVTTVIEIGWTSARIGIVLTETIHAGWRLFATPAVLADVDAFAALVREGMGAGNE